MVFVRWINTDDVALRYSVAESLEHENFCCAQLPASGNLRRTDYNIGARSALNYRTGSVSDLAVSPDSTEGWVWRDIIRKRSRSQAVGLN